MSTVMQHDENKTESQKWVDEFNQAVSLGFSASQTEQTKYLTYRDYT